jgi:ATP-dependent RNA helicase RhlE
MTNYSRQGGNSSHGRSNYRGNSNNSGSGFSKGRSGGGNGGGRTPRVPKEMDVDLSLLVKTAKPQKMEDYTAQHKFEDFGLDEQIVATVKAKGFTTPSPIQDKVIKEILQKKDVLGIANTGTGKTAAFLLPLIHQVYNDLTKTILILAPTRELAHQIYKELKTFVTNSAVSSTVVVGGENIDKQIRDLNKKKHFVIATTGRCLDLIKQRKFPIKYVDTIVLDEMDQMLDMGFINDIRKILELATNRQHLLFFSATSTKGINDIAMEILDNPTKISVVRGQTTDNVNQDIVEIEEGVNKLEKLHEILSKPEVTKAIVFENTKHGSNKIEIEMVKRGLRATAIHGNKSQNQRNRALEQFKNGQVDVLIATNVAARGLDIPNVSHVVNFSLPESKEDYIHRIGRTGRANETGHALTFVTTKQLKKASRY